MSDIYMVYAIARWQVIPVNISNTWSCCNCTSDYSVTAWSYWTAARFHWSSMIMLQLLYAITSLVNPFIYKAWCAWRCALWLQPGLTVMVWAEAMHEWPSARNICHWLADSKATICEPKCTYTALPQQNASCKGVISAIVLDFFAFYL